MPLLHLTRTTIGLMLGMYLVVACAQVPVPHQTFTAPVQPRPLPEPPALIGGDPAQGLPAGWVLPGATYPALSWEAIDPANLSPQCTDGLARTHQRLLKSQATAMLAVQDGRVLFSHGPVEVPSIVESVRKSVLSMMYGPYVANGTIDLDKTLAELGIDDVGGLLPIERTARLRDLISARSGVYHAAANTGDYAADAPPRGSQQPGRYFLYNNWDFNAAGTAFEQLTHQDFYAAFDALIAKPLQLQDFKLTGAERRGNRPGRSHHRVYNLFLSTRDMARIGQLALQRGAWRGQQLIPAAWMDESTTAVTASQDMHPTRAQAHHLGYGLMWWTMEEPATSPLHGAYLAWGLHGQFILVVPARRMVVVLKRMLPVAGQWDVPAVGKPEFLALARSLIEAPCEIQSRAEPTR